MSLIIHVLMFMYFSVDAFRAKLIIIIPYISIYPMEDNGHVGYRRFWLEIKIKICTDIVLFYSAFYESDVGLCSIANQC